MCWSIVQAETKPAAKKDEKGKAAKESESESEEESSSEEESESESEDESKDAKKKDDKEVKKVKWYFFTINMDQGTTSLTFLRAFKPDFAS